MPIAIACPDCDTRLNAPDAAAGKTVKCPKCGCRIIVPAAEPADEPDEAPPPRRTRAAVPDDEDETPRKKKRPRDAEEDEDEEDDRPRKKKGKKPAKAGPPAWVFAAGGGVLLLAVGVVIAVLALGGKKDDKTAASGSGGGDPGSSGGAGRSGGSGVPDGWTEVNEPEGGFRVLLPGQARKYVIPQGGSLSPRLANLWEWNNGTLAPDQTRVRAAAVTLKDGTTPGNNQAKLFDEFGKLVPGPFAWGEVESKTTRTVSGRTAVVVRLKERVVGADVPEFKIDPNTPKEVQDNFREANEERRKRLAEERSRVEREGKRAVYLVLADEKKVYFAGIETAGPVDEKAVAGILDSFQLL